MSVITRIASRAVVPPQEIINLLLLLSFAVVSGFGMFVVRGEIPSTSLDPAVRDLQFSLAYILIGFLPVLFVRAAGTEGRAVAIFLFISMLVGLWINPRIDPINVIITLVVILGSFTYYGVYSNASNRELIVAIGLILMQGYAFSIYYINLAYESTGDLRIAGLSGIYLTVAIIILGRLLVVEFRKASAGAGWTP